MTLLVSSLRGKMTQGGGGWRVCVCLCKENEMLRSLLQDGMDTFMRITVNRR